MFLITLKQVGIMVGYIFLGYILCRKNIISKQASRFLSKILIYVVQPCYNINSLAKQITVDKILDYMMFILAGGVVVIVGILLSKIISNIFTKQPFERRIYQYMFVFSNMGYFGYPLIGEVFGPEVLASFMLFGLPVSIAINSYGYYILTSDDGETECAGEGKFLNRTQWKRVFSVPLLSLLLAIVLGLLPIELPQLFFDIITPGANCYSACPMWLMGISLASYSLKELFSLGKPYIAGAIRLLLIPLIMGGLALLLQGVLNFDIIIVTFVVALTCLPAGMNVVVFPESVGKDGSFGAKACIVCYLMGLVTIPLWFYLLSFIH